MTSRNRHDMQGAGLRERAVQIVGHVFSVPEQERAQQADLAGRTIEFRATGFRRTQRDRGSKARRARDRNLRRAAARERASAYNLIGATAPSLRSTRNRPEIERSPYAAGAAPFGNVHITSSSPLARCQSATRRNLPPGPGPSTSSGRRRKPRFDPGHRKRPRPLSRIRDRAGRCWPHSGPMDCAQRDR